MAKATFSADSASFPALIFLSFAGPGLPPGGSRRRMAAHSARLSAPTRN
jgi:hypothetical protein